MSVFYDIYQPGRSWLHRLDPRVKVINTLCACALLLVMRNVWFMVAMMLLLHLMLYCGDISRQRIVWVWRMAWPTMAMIALLWILLYRQEGTLLLNWWFLHITAQNLAEGVAVALRIGAMAFAVFAWLFSTDQSTLVHSLVSLGLPYDWGLTLAIALRYLPAMSSAFAMISDAQKARALDLRQGNLLQRLRAYLPITVSMLITALRTAQNLSHALESRALGAVQKRTYLRQLHATWIDWLVGLSVVVITGLLVWMRYRYGWCADPLHMM